MTEPRIAIRSAQRDDAPAIAALATQLGYPMIAEEAAARFAQLGRMPDHCVLVAELEGQVAGWAHVERRVNLESGVRAELMGLVVDSRVRRAGIGKRLVAAVEQWAVTRGLATMVVRSNVTREAAHAFYRQLGYDVSKSQHVFQKSMKHDAHRA
jgi:GNAT superfamily N-acetyltransferase